MIVRYRSMQGDYKDMAMDLTVTGFVQCPECKCQHFNVGLDTVHYFDLICLDCGLVIHILSRMEG